MLYASYFSVSSLLSDVTRLIRACEAVNFIDDIKETLDNRYTFEKNVARNLKRLEIIVSKIWYGILYSKSFSKLNNKRPELIY